MTDLMLNCFANLWAKERGVLTKKPARTSVFQSDVSRYVMERNHDMERVEGSLRLGGYRRNYRKTRLNDFTLGGSGFSG